MKIILISGKAEAGKTTAANFLKEELESRGERVAITPYGRLVKDLCNMLYGWNGEKDEAGRQLLQRFGTDIVRAMRPDYWVDHIIDLALMLNNEFDTFIIDDCRFPNEVVSWEGKWFKTFDNAFDVYWLRIERPGYENHLTPEQRMHASETALDGYELPEGSSIDGIYVKNNSGLMEFRDTVIKAFDYLELYGETVELAEAEGWDNAVDDFNAIGCPTFMLTPEELREKIGYDEEHDHE